MGSGADLAAEDSEGRTPLHLAVLARHRPQHQAVFWGELHMEVIRVILDAGADVDAKHNGGGTPLDEAARESPRNSPEVKAAKKETADLLRKHGGKTGEELKAEQN